jgi:superfamily II DNA/RNA helicase
MQKLRADKHTVDLLTSDLIGSERDAIIDDYRNGKIKILLSTNVLARGIDILQVVDLEIFPFPPYSQSLTSCSIDCTCDQL